MIYKVEIDNFHSIRNLQVVDLMVSGNPPQDTNRLASCWTESTKRAPKVVAVFGANGSGKSNLLRALSFVTWFVEDSYVNNLGNSLPFDPFFDEYSINRPTLIKIWFSAVDFLESSSDCDSTRHRPYCYELEISNKEVGGEIYQHVLNEAIFYWPIKSGRKTCMIQRSGDGAIRATKSFELSGFKPALDKVLRSNASVISTLANLGHSVSTAIVQFVQTIGYNIFINKLDLDEQSISRQYFNRPDVAKLFNREIQRLDYGVRSLEVNSNEDNYQFKIHHEGLCRPIVPDHESHGTLQLLKFYPLITGVIGTGSVALIDQLDAALHPMIIAEILEWFYDTDRNTRDAQLWMSCHSASLLEELSKEEILFCEKNRRGTTEIYCLNEIQAVRRNDNYYRKYLGGVYGALPQIG